MFNKRVESAFQTFSDRGSTPLSSTIIKIALENFFFFTFFGVSRAFLIGIFKVLLLFLCKNCVSLYLF